MNQQNVSDLSKHPTGGLRRMLTVQGPPATQSSARRVRSEHAGDRLRPKRTFRTFTPCRLSARTSPVQSSARLRSTLPVHARLPQSHGRTPATALFVSSHPISKSSSTDWTNAFLRPTPSCAYRSVISHISRSGRKDTGASKPCTQLVG